MTDENEREIAGPEDKDAPWELPDRHAFSILPGSSTTGILPTLDGTSTPTTTPTAGDAGATGAQAGDTASQLAHTTGDASGSGTENVTSDPRSETFTSSDSAYAGPEGQ
jgi:hypothetical protein